MVLGGLLAKSFYGLLPVDSGITLPLRKITMINLWLNSVPILFFLGAQSKFSEVNLS